VSEPIAGRTIADRYELVRILGRNASGGRVTYLARDLEAGASVALKKFQFANDGDWRGYDAIAREFEILQAIAVPGVPRYLGSFETDRAVYLVQEYRDAPNLAARLADPNGAIDAATVRHLIADLLEILTGLQACVPPILHRDLKPENILLSDAGEVFLVDFGFARRGVSGEGDGTASSLVRGTLGFMAPEQILNRSLTLATDLYGLGATLICLWTGTPSDRVGDWVGDGFRIEVDRAVPQLPEAERRWLARLVAPEVGERFPSAAAALAAWRDLEDFENLGAGDAQPEAKTAIEPAEPIALAAALRELPVRTLAILAIVSGVFAGGLDLWWSLSVGVGRAIEAALRSLLSI